MVVYVQVYSILIIKQQEVDKMKIVLMKNIKYNFDSVLIVDDDGKTHTDDEYVAVSEVIDVEFPMIDVDIDGKKIAFIDKDIAKARAGIELLEQAKAELLSIPDMRGR